MAPKSTSKKAKKGTAKKRKVARKVKETEVLEPEIIEAEVIEPSSSPAKLDTKSVSRPETVEEETSTELVPDDPLNKYLSEIKKYPVLSREEEFDLAVKYRESGDKEAAQALITANLRFVVKVAAEYSKFGAKLIDLIQEGNMGLMQALKDYNPYKGVRLISYAVWWIRGQIQEYLMRHYSMVRIGTTANQRKLFYQLQKQVKELESLGLEPDIKQLASRLDVPEKDVKLMTQRMSGKDISLDQPVKAGDDSSTTLLDLQNKKTEIPIDEALMLQEQLHLLGAALEELRPQLNEKEQYLLDNRILGDPAATLQEVGDHFGITREAVRQTEVRLLNKIKENFNQN